MPRNAATNTAAYFIAAIATIGLVAYALAVREPAPPAEPLAQAISTQYGVLTLRYADGRATLTGTLARSTPCIEWSGSVAGTEDDPPSRVEFTLTRTATADICIQVLGAPYEVSLESKAGIGTHYTVRVAGATVFSGPVSAGE